MKNPDSKRPVGNAAFRKAWAKATAHHKDDWGVNCAYDFEGWLIWKAAVRHTQKTLGYRIGRRFVQQLGKEPHR